MTKPMIIVTGACGTAGRAIAATLAARNLSVAGIDIGPPPEGPSDFTMFLSNTDLTDPAATERAFDRIRSAQGGVCGLVNVAGGFVWKTFADSALSDWDDQWRLNFRTCLNATRAALPMIQTGGSILNIGAAGAVKAGPGMSAYAASKSAVMRLTESLSEELKPRRIRVNALLPTIIDTPANRKDIPEADPSLWIRPEELAEVAAFLISDAASAINGALVPVAGRL